MLLRSIFWALVLMLLSFSTVYADSMTASVSLDGSSAESFTLTDPNTNQTTTFSLSPYGGTLDGQAAEFICLNINEPVPSMSGWMSNVTTLGNAANDYTNTELKSEMPYLVMGELSVQLENAVAEFKAGDQNAYATVAAYQFAIWSFSTSPGGTPQPGPDPYAGTTNPNLSAAALVQNATNIVDAGGFATTGWEILTPSIAGTGQEFLVQTPEPSSLLLLCAGLLGFAVWGRRRAF